MSTRYIFPVTILLLVVLLALILRPVPTATAANTVHITGRLAGVTLGPGADINLWLDNSDDHFYINRGSERGVDIENLRHKVGEWVTLRYVPHRTLLDPQGKTHHIAEVRFGDDIYYTEVK